jgi:hypothetical protein
MKPIFYSISVFFILILNPHFGSAHPSESDKVALLKKSPPKLAPPWWILNMKMQATIGKTPGIDVGNLEVIPSSSCWRCFLKSSQAIIPITTSNQEVANSLALVLEDTYDTGGMKIKLEISGPQGPGIAPLPPADITLIEFVEKQITLALKGNPYFVTIHRLPSHMPLAPDLSVEFGTTEIQIHDDNLFDYYGYNTFVAQSLFTEFLKNQFFYNSVTSATTTSPVAALSKSDPHKTLPMKGLYPSLTQEFGSHFNPH